MNPNELSSSLESVLQNYSQSFAAKIFGEESLEEDDLMLIFGLTQAIKAGNKQYWGRELGMCWQRLVTEVYRQTCDDFRPAIREGKDEICDLVVGRDAIDTKYRIGSGDAGILKKLRQYSFRLRELGFRPVLLILRNDSLRSSIISCTNSGWIVMSGSDTYEYLRETTEFDLELWLKARINRYNLLS